MYVEMSKSEVQTASWLECIDHAFYVVTLQAASIWAYFETIF